MNRLTHANPIAPFSAAFSQQKAYAGNLLHAIICTSLKESGEFGREYPHPEQQIKLAGKSLNLTNGTVIVNFILEEQSMVQLITIIDEESDIAVLGQEPIRHQGPLSVLIRRFVMLIAEAAPPPDPAATPAALQHAVQHGVVAMRAAVQDSMHYVHPPTQSDKEAKDLARAITPSARKSNSGAIDRHDTEVARQYSLREHQKLKKTSRTSSDTSDGVSDTICGKKEPTSKHGPWSIPTILQLTAPRQPQPRQVL